MHVIPHLPLQRGQSTPSQKTIKVKNHSLLSPKHVLDATDGSDHVTLLCGHPWPNQVFLTHKEQSVVTVLQGCIENTLQVGDE